MPALDLSHLASPKAMALGSMRRIAPAHTTRPRKSSIPIPFRPRVEASHPQGLPSFNLPPLPSRSSVDSMNIQMATPPQAGQYDNRAQGNLNVGSEDAERWDDDFAADVTLSHIGRK